MAFGFRSAEVSRIPNNVIGNLSVSGNLYFSDGVGLIGSTASLRPGAINIGGRTVIVNTQPALSIAEIWNEGATVFTGIKLKITNTACAAGSLLLDLQYGAAAAEASVFNVSIIGNVTIASGAMYSWSTQSTILSPSDGVVTLCNAAKNDFGRLQFGGTTSAFPALKRSSTSLLVYLADDSGFASIFAANIFGYSALINGGNNGQLTSIQQATVLSGAMSGATLTLSNLIPAGSLVVGVTVRVTTLITGATSFTIGDGTDVDKWGTGVAVAAGTTTTLANVTSTAPTIYTAATNVVLTAAGGNFTAGVVRVTVHYISLTAPIS
jgi:hypothetical protein